jgi:prolyl-tRNA synthetase
MRMSGLFGRTLREAPADAEMISHQLLLRAGMIRLLGAGIYTLMPLGWRVQFKLQDIMRQEMNAVGGQELLMPVVHPAEVWQASGRWDVVDETLLRFRDRTGHDMVLAMTHEEVIADLLGREIDSYRRLPAMVYHIQTKFRDERRPRGGLIRVREFVMKDAYSLHADAGDLEAFYPKMLRAYQSIFARCDIEPLMVEADSGMMGGSASHEFMLLNERGEDDVVTCDSCSYAANAEHATFGKAEQPRTPLQPLAEVATPGCTTIQEVAQFIGVPASQTLKAVFFSTEGQEPQLIFALIRGDLEVNEAKLSRAVGGRALRRATDQEIRAAGAVPGYASPLAVRAGQALVIADDSIYLGNNFVAGANREGYHVTGVNPGRDFEPDTVADIALARPGDRCPRCGTTAPPSGSPGTTGRLQIKRGIELGHCFKLGTRYTLPANITYLDTDGQEQHIVMGSYGIGIGRLLAAVVETHHDEHGIRWPVAVAPYTIHLVSLVRTQEQTAQADALYETLARAGLEVLYDDRAELSAGVKFNDADLIGCPLRLTFSQRNLQRGSIEAKLRTSDTREMVPLDGIVAYARERLGLYEEQLTGF